MRRAFLAFLALVGVLLALSEPAITQTVVRLYGTLSTGAQKAVLVNADGSLAVSLAAGQTIPAGTGTATATLGGVLTTSTTQTCTSAGTGEEVLWTYSLPASTLSADGKGIRVTVHATLAANGNTKIGRLYFGSTVVATRGGADNGVTQIYLATIYRTSATAQLAFSDIRNGSGNGGTATSTPAETLANATTIKWTGQDSSASAADMCFRSATVETLK